MTYHRNDKAAVELLATWGHGKPRPEGLIERDGVLICDDGDGHYDAWAFTGDKREAALLIASVTRFRPSDETLLLVLGEGGLEAIGRSDWAEGVETVEYDEDGEPIEYHYNPAAHPGGLVMT